MIYLSPYSYSWSWCSEGGERKTQQRERERKVHSLYGMVRWEDEGGKERKHCMDPCKSCLCAYSAVWMGHDVTLGFNIWRFILWWFLYYCTNTEQHIYSGSIKWITYYPLQVAS